VRDIVFPNNEKLCSDWLDGYTLSTALNITTSLVVEIVNEIAFFIIACNLSLFLNNYLVLSQF